MLTLTFGALAEPIAKQVRAQGHCVPARLFAHAQKDADAIARLDARLLLRSSAVRQARKFVLQDVIDIVNEHAKGSR